MANPPRVPDFIGIGVQRSGTSWLYRNLQRYPAIYMFPGLKEVHYFDEVHLDREGSRLETSLRNLARMERRLENAGDLTPHAQSVLARLRTDERDDDWYKLLFSLAPTDKLAGEITPAYSLLPASGIEHMMSLNRDMRFLLMLRHPVDRAWSHVRFRLRRTWFTENEGPPPAELLRRMAVRPSNLQRTAYRSMIETYRSVVPDEQLAISFYERVASDSDALLAELGTFLGQDPTSFGPLQASVKTHPNAAPSVPMPDGLREELLVVHRDQLQWVADNIEGVPDAWLADLG